VWRSRCVAWSDARIKLARVRLAHKPGSLGEQDNVRTLLPRDTHGIAATSAVGQYFEFWLKCHPYSGAKARALIRDIV